MKRNSVSLLCTALAGCATTADPNYMAQLDAYRLTVNAQYAAEAERAKVEAARYAAMEAVARFGDQGTHNMALLALALSGRSGGDARSVNVSLPQAPESQEARAYKWVALFATPVAMLAQGYFGYRLGVTQSNANRDTTVAGYNAIGGVANAGFGAAQGIATSGFNAAGNIATSGFNAISAIVPTMQPNIILSGSGVIGNGSFTGPNSGAASGNSGNLNYQSPTTNPVCVILPNQPPC